MHSPADRVPRVARSAVFALAAVTLGALAHSLGHGTAPRLPVVAAAAVAVFAGAQLAAARERSFAAIAAAMAAVQVGLHVVLMTTIVGMSWASMLPAGLSPAAVASTPVHGGPSVVLPAALCSHPSIAVAGGSWWPMVGAHALAALLLAWGLRCGEATFWALARAVRHVGRRLITLLGPTGRAEGPTWLPPGWGEPAVRRLRGRLLRHCVVLRGPPALAA